MLQTVAPLTKTPMSRQPSLLPGWARPFRHTCYRKDLARSTARRLLAPKYPHFERLAPAFETAGVETRYCVQPLEWYEEPHGWADRGAAYLEGATALLIDAARNALSAAGMDAEEIDTIVTVSSTGIATQRSKRRPSNRSGFAECPTSAGFWTWLCRRRHRARHRTQNGCAAQRTDCPHGNSRSLLPRIPHGPPAKSRHHRLGAFWRWCSGGSAQIGVRV